MSVTPLSTSTPYCSASDFLTRYDYRPIAQLMNDADSASVTRNNLLNVPTATDEGNRLLEILMECSGEVEAAALLGKRYTPAELMALTGASLAYLKRLVADLAIGRCYERRPMVNPWAAATQTARQLLNAIGSGEAIFGTQEAADASLLEARQETMQQIDNRKGVVTGKMRGYFGSAVGHRGAIDS